MSTLLTLLNALALALMAIALLIARLKRVDRTEHGRALMVSLTALALVSVTGMFRRMGSPVIDQVVMVSLCGIIAVGIWMLRYAERGTD